MTGQVLSHYRVLEKLGEGGMGVVYKAEDTKLRRTVALKLLPSHLTGHKDRFLREAQAAAALNHNNICTIYEVDEDRGYIAMEYLAGVTLKDRIAERPLPLSAAIDIAVQTCQGLQHAHEQGVVHRDIKPANLMIDPQGQLKIMDFGLAQLEDRTRITTDGSSAGTPAYMSPEQVQGGEADRRSDIWSLGVVVYEMITGRRPFPGETEQAVSFGIVHTDPEQPTALRSGLPLELDRILAKALAKQATQRYQTVADLAVDLRALGASRQALSSPRKRPWQRYALAAVLVVGIAGFAGWRGLAPVPPIRSIAILPLRSIGPEAAEGFLGLGIADALITKIAQTGQLQVRPISAVRRYAKGDSDPLEAARQLNAEAVLEGNLQQSGTRLRISVHLLRTGTGESMWTQTFDANAGDVFAMQDDIAKQVAGQLRLKLDPEQRRDFEKRYTSNPQAFELYTKAVHHLDNRNRREEVSLAIELFKRAIELDPAYALARAELGYAYAWYASIHVDDPKMIELARSELLQAEKIDPRIAQIHVARSLILWSQYGGWNVKQAINEMRSALRLNPNAGQTNLANYYAHTGLEALADKFHKLAILAEPESESAKNTYITDLYYAYRMDEAAEAEQRLFHRGPRVQYYLTKGMLKEAGPLVESAIAVNPERLEGRINRALYHALKGDLEAARRQIATVEAEAELLPRLMPFHHTAYAIARVRARLGDAAKAHHWLQITAATGFPQFPMMERDRMLDPVRKDLAVAKILAAVKSTWEGHIREFGAEDR